MLEPLARLLKARNCEQQLLLEQILTQTAIQLLLIKRVANNAEHSVIHATTLLTTTSSQGLGSKTSKRIKSQVTTQNMLLT